MVGIANLFHKMRLSKKSFFNKYQLIFLKFYFVFEETSKVFETLEVYT